MTFIAAALLAASQPVAPQPAAPSPTPAPIAAPADDGRQGYALSIAEAILPDGSYARMMQEMMGGEDGMMGMMLDMSLADFVGEEALAKASKDGKLPADAKQTMREAMRKSDPHFEERFTITMKVMAEEMGRMFAPLEPRMRGALARTFARKFDAGQLRDVAAFYATPTGRTFAAQSLMAFADREMMAEMMKAIPSAMKDMPAMLAKVEKATAHLPKPPKKKPAKS